MSGSTSYPCGGCGKPISRSAKLGSGRCATCNRRAAAMTHPTWFGRWRVYPWSCAGHIAQGVLAGLLPLPGLLLLALADTEPEPGLELLALGLLALGIAIGYIWWRGFEAYQRLSFQRKVNTTGRGDTAGLDAYDFIVGYVPVSIVPIVSVAGIAFARGGG